MELNYYKINFPFENYQVNSEPYTDARFLELRSNHNSTHSFFRDGECIYISNKDGDEASEIGKPSILNIYKDEKVTSSLIKHIFFRTFKDRFPGYVPTDFYPFRFFSKQEKDDVIYHALPDNLKNIIAYKKLIELQLRQITLNGIKTYGFVINIRRNWIFKKSCFELKIEGFNLIGLEVLRNEHLPNLNGILEPDEELIGTIKTINGLNAIVKTNNGDKEYPLEDLSIRKTKYNLGAYLSFAISEVKSQEILQIIESKRHEIYNAEKLHREIGNISKQLFSESLNGESSLVQFENKDGFCFTVNAAMLQTADTMQLKTPTFIFDYANTKVNNSSPDIGLTNFGPYDSTTFDLKSPRFVCIGSKDNRGHFAAFMANLIEGLPQSKYFKKGLLKKYEFHQITPEIYDIPSCEFEDYQKIIRELDGQRPDLILIEIPHGFRNLPDVTNPYYRIKAKLLQLEIPVQFITSELIKNHNEYILNSVALQIYAKLGGTPWVLPSNRSVDREIIIGIGHSWIRDNAFIGANLDRVVGITTFMSSDGQYLLSDKAKDVSYEDYFQELLRSLTNSFERLEQEYGWVEGDTIRLIFHIFKPIKNIEFEVVAELIKRICKFRIQFSFVTISKVQPFKMFNPREPGIQNPYGRDVKGAFIPLRGSNFFLDPHSAIVQMFGPKELKTAKHGMSNPILIQIRKPSGNFEIAEIERLMFTDLSYVVQQLFSFTYLSWRSFLPGEQPATMLYSNLISQLLGKLRKVPGWDSDTLNFKFKRKKWFL